MNNIKYQTLYIDESNFDKLEEYIEDGYAYFEVKNTLSFSYFDFIYEHKGDNDIYLYLYAKELLNNELEKDEEKHFQILKDLYESKCFIAFSSLSNCYMYGNGTKQDIDLAFKILDEGIKAGNMVCINNLACALVEGKYLNKDIDKANELFLIAANNGVRIAQYNLGRNYEIDKDYENAFKWYKLAADQWHLTSTYKVGSFYYRGLGVKKSFDNGIYYLYKASSRGHKKALEEVKKILNHPFMDYEEEEWFVVDELYLD